MTDINSSQLPPDAELSRTYDTFVALCCIVDTICPPWAHDKIQGLINELADRLPNRIELVLLDED